MVLMIGSKAYENISDSDFETLFNENGIDIDACEREDAGLRVNFILDGRIVAIVSIEDED